MTQVVGGMVMIAEVFANQGYDLYSFETKKGVTVHTMVDFLITYIGYPKSGAKKKAYIDPEIMDTKRILRKTGINDNTLGWAHAYVKRFPNKETTKKLIVASKKLFLLSEEYYNSAYLGLAFLPIRSRFAILLALITYRQIGRKIIRKKYSNLDKRDLLNTFGLDKKIQKKDSFFHNANSAFLKSFWLKVMNFFYIKRLFQILFFFLKI